MWYLTVGRWVSALVVGVWEEWETHPLAGSLALLAGCSVGREHAGSRAAEIRGIDF